VRFAAIADIHGNLEALEAVLADIARLDVRDIVNLGDCVSGPLLPAEVADRLIALGLPTVRGNHDRYLVEQMPEAMGRTDRYARDRLTPAHLAWLNSLPFDRVWWNEVYLCHATPTDDNTYWLETVSPEGVMHQRPIDEVEAMAAGVDYSLILCGHTHTPRTVRLRDGRLIVNPGSVGCPGYEDDQPYPHVMQAGNPLASYAILEKDSSGWSVTCRQVPYDFEAAARLARENDRHEWATALATGWLR
jgi:predicted phosphodiesterase